MTRRYFHKKCPKCKTDPGLKDTYLMICRCGWKAPWLGELNEV